MADIDIPRLYVTGEALTESDLDAIQSAVTTFINTTKITSDNIQGNALNADTKLAPASISTSILGDAAVTTAKIASDGVTTAKIADSAVTADKLAATSINSTLIPDLAVTTAKLEDLAITTAKIEDAAIDGVARVVQTRHVSNSTGASTSSTSFTTIATYTGISCTTGRALFLNVGPADSSGSYIATPASSTSYVSGTYEYQMQVSTDSGTSYTTFYSTQMRADVGGYATAGYQTMPASGIWAIFTPSTTGTHYFRVQHRGYYTYGTSTHLSGAISCSFSIHEIL